jgi:hypothetical protein
MYNFIKLVQATMQVKSKGTEDIMHWHLYESMTTSPKYISNHAPGFLQAKYLK